MGDTEAERLVELQKKHCEIWNDLNKMKTEEEFDAWNEKNFTPPLRESYHEVACDGQRQLHQIEKDLGEDAFKNCDWKGYIPFLGSGNFDHHENREWGLGSKDIRFKHSHWSCQEGGGLKHKKKKSRKKRKSHKKRKSCKKK